MFNIKRVNFGLPFFLHYYSKHAHCGLSCRKTDEEAPYWLWEQLKSGGKNKIVYYCSIII
jgi:hypothetical protein